MDSTGSDTGATNAPEPTGSGAETVSAVARAQEMRASLGARRDAEAMLAEASQLRRTAAADADAIVEEAQQISLALLDEGKQHAEQTTAEARERADGILARARADAAELAEQAHADAEAVRLDSARRADEHREQIRAEVSEQSRRELVSVRQQSHSLIGDAEARMKALGADLESATKAVAEVLATLGHLRTSSVDALPEPTPADMTRLDSDEPAATASQDSFPVTTDESADAPEDDTGADTGADRPDLDVAAADAAPGPTYASVPPPAVAAQAPAFAPASAEPTAPHADRPRAEVPEPSVSSFAEPAVAEVPRAEVPRAAAPERSVASFAEPAEHAEHAAPAEPSVADLARADVRRELDSTREVPAVPADQAPSSRRLDSGSSSIFAAAREEMDSDTDRTRDAERSAGARAAEFRGDLRDEGPAHRPAAVSQGQPSSHDDEVAEVREETLEVMPDSERRDRDSEPAASRPLGWLFRSAQ